jgi:hypothetical protein
MNRVRNLAGLALGLAVVAAVCGCRTATPTVRKPSTEIDPCAERLHEVCGYLLLQYAIHETLPESLADLQGVTSAPLPPLVCPVSGKAYIYNRDGIEVPGRPGRVVLYDAAPTHSGMRWAVAAEVNGTNQPLTARVILLPESVFTPGSN